MLEAKSRKVCVCTTKPSVDLHHFSSMYAYILNGVHEVLSTNIPDGANGVDGILQASLGARLYIDVATVCSHRRTILLRTVPHL